MKTNIHKSQLKALLFLGLFSFLSTTALATIEIAERTAPGSIVQWEGHINVWLQKRVSSSSVTSNFFFPGGASKRKLIERPELVNVWKTVKDIDGIDMADLLKNKFPDPSANADFYDAFKEQFLQPSSNGLENVFEVADANKVEIFLKDIGGPDNSLINAFVGQPGLFNGWKAVFDNDLDDAIRVNVDAIGNISSSITEGLDAIDAVEDAIQTLNKTKWEEIKTFFQRGNDFNRKARDEAWYDFNEVHLENGKRLDSYDHDIGEIVSRKATDFDNILPATFEKYLKEIDSKFAPGTIIRSNKYPEIDGQALYGTKIIEVPISNQSSPNLATFEALASQYNTIIRFRQE